MKSGKVLLILLAAFIIITGLVSSRRAVKGSNDFDTFYLAGRAVLEQTGEVYYTGDTYEDAAAKGPFLYPPFAAIFFALFAWMPAAPAAFLWNAFNVLIFAAVLWLIAEILGKAAVKNLSQLSLPAKLAAAAITGALLIDNLTMAQVNIFVFALTLSSVFLWQKNRSLAAGVTLSAAVLIKVMPVIFCIYFIAKRQWRLLAGVFLGFILFTLVLPTLVFGMENNRLLHRQWLGRTVKPLLIEYVGKWDERIAGPFPTRAAKVQHDRLTGRLTQKNQSLEAAMTRVLLRERNEYANDPEHPVHAAKKYQRMPVLLGGLRKEILGAVLFLTKLGIIGLMFILWLRPAGSNTSPENILCLALAFTAMPLLAPWARSHQFIVWLFPYAVYFLGKTAASAANGVQPHSKKWVSRGIYLSMIFYVFQALPYGKAFGFGAWANLILWFAVAYALAVSLRAARS